MARFHALLHIMLAEVATAQGGVEEAERHLQEARRHLGARRSRSSSDRCSRSRPKLMLWRHDPVSAWEEVEQGLEAVESSEHHEAVLRLLWLGVRCLADLAESAVRTHLNTDRGGDGAYRARRALSSRRSRAAASACHRRRRPPKRSAQRCSASQQQPDAGAWRAVRAAWDALGFPFPGAYARWRLAETLTAQRKLVAASRRGSKPTRPPDLGLRRSRQSSTACNGAPGSG